MTDAECNEKILTQLALHTVWQKGIANDIKEIKRCLNGNGRPGLCLDVDRLKQTESFRGRLLWVTMGASITAIITQAASAL